MRTLMLVLGACLLLPACDDKKADEPKKEEIKWPEKPVDGSNVALELVRVEDDGATFKVYNFADQDLKQVSIKQRFLDEAGKELDTFPHMAMGMPLVGKKSMEEVKTVIMSKPDGMKTVEGVLRKAEWSDGTKWNVEDK